MSGEFRGRGIPLPSLHERRLTRSVQRILAVRMARMRRTLPQVCRTDLDGFMALRGTGHAFGDPLRLIPFWLLLPCWVARQRESPTTKRSLNDILWGQFCVTLAVTIHDDILDRQAANANAIFLGDQILLEGIRTFAKMFGSATPFWPFFYRSCNRGFVAGREIQAAQKIPNISTTRILRLYADQYAICTIALYAVCLLNGNVKQFRLLSKYHSFLAQAGQLVDDLEDLVQDHRDGRWNACARLLNAADGRQQEISLRRVARSVLSPLAGRLFFRNVRGLVRKASRVAGRSGLMPARSFADSLLVSIHGMERSFHSPEGRVALYAILSRARAGLPSA